MWFPSKSNKPWVDRGATKWSAAIVMSIYVIFVANRFQATNTLATTKAVVVGFGSMWVTDFFFLWSLLSVSFSLILSLSSFLFLESTVDCPSSAARRFLRGSGFLISNAKTTHDFNWSFLKARRTLNPNYAIEAKKCPICRQENIKDGGNNHILCWACGCHWCWMCRQKVEKTSQHFGPQYPCKQHS